MLTLKITSQAVRYTVYIKCLLHETLIPNILLHAQFCLKPNTYVQESKLSRNYADSSTYSRLDKTLTV